MFWRRSREADVKLVGLVGELVPLGALAFAPSVGLGLVPGWRDWRPRGVSRITRKWPVKGGARVAGRVSGST